MLTLTNTMIAKSPFVLPVWIHAMMLMSEDDKVSLRALQGRTRNTQGVGTVELLCFKSQLVSHLTRTFAANAKLEETPTKTLAAYAEDPYTWFGHYGWPKSQDLPDQTWRGGWPPSSDRMAKLIDDAIFGFVYDDNFKTALRAAKGVEDLCETDGSSKDVPAETMAAWELKAVGATEDTQAGQANTTSADDTPSIATTAAPAVQSMLVDEVHELAKAAQPLHDDTAARQRRAPSHEDIEPPRRLGQKAARASRGQAREGQQPS